MFYFSMTEEVRFLVATGPFFADLYTISVAVWLKVNALLMPLRSSQIYENGKKLVGELSVRCCFFFPGSGYV